MFIPNCSFAIRNTPHSIYQHSTLKYFLLPYSLISLYLLKIFQYLIKVRFLNHNSMPKFKRRDFIKSSVMAGVGASVLKVDPLIANTSEEQPVIPTKTSASKKIIVGGGGLGGLCCAYELMKKGHE